MRKIIFSLLLVVLSVVRVSAQEVDIQKLLARGINFDHIFFPYNSDRPYTPEMWQTMREKLQASQFKQVADLGFTHIRLNLGRAFLQDLKPPYALRPDGLKLLDKALKMATDNGLGIIVDMHQTPAPDVFHKPEALKAYQHLWEGLTAHLIHQPLSVVFELMNEPAIPELAKPDPSKKDLDKWRKIQKDLVAIIHKRDPKRYVIVTGGGWGNAEGLVQLGSLDLPRVVYTFHDYAPFIFTHQGATWVDPSVKFLRSIHYPVTEKEVQANWKTVKENHYLDWAYVANPHGFDEADMAKSLQPLFDHAKQKGIMIYCGEFGVHKPYAPAKDRARWTKDMVDLLTKNGVCWSMWAYHAGFDLADEKDVPDPAMVKALGLKK